MLIVRVSSTSSVSPSVFSMRCPRCRQLGTFDALGSDIFIQGRLEEDGAALGTAACLGQRICPNDQCRAQVFVLMRQNGDPLASYPPERIDFDASQIPISIVAALEEAITCHANQCYKAAAMLIRKTLEQLCEANGAKGKDLKARIGALASRVVLPTGLLGSLDDLRLLGNDAAHIESREYDKIGKDEVEIGIELTKEILKAVYQYTALVKKLADLKKKKRVLDASAESETAAADQQNANTPNS